MLAKGMAMVMVQKVKKLLMSQIWISLPIIRNSNNWEKWWVFVFQIAILFFIFKVRADPSALPQIVQQIAQTNPELMQMIRNRQVFY